MNREKVEESRAKERRFWIQRRKAMPGGSKAHRTRHGGVSHGEGGAAWMRAMRRLPCHYCGGPGGTVDLVIPRSKGGAAIQSNAVPACAPCNNFRKNKDYEEFKRVGWKRRMFA